MIDSLKILMSHLKLNCKPRIFSYNNYKGVLNKFQAINLFSNSSRAEYTRSGLVLNTTTA